MKQEKQVKTRCSHCKGKSIVTCPQCGGKGYLPWFRGSVRQISIHWCSACCGKGVVPCRFCCPEAAAADLLPRE